MFNLYTLSCQAEIAGKVAHFGEAMTGHKSSTICGVAEWAEDQKSDLYLVSVWLIHVHKLRLIHAPGDKE